MQFLETWSEVKFKVTVTQIWYATLRHPKRHPHSKLEIPTSNILREKSLAIYFEDSQFKRNRTFDFIVSKIYVDKRSRAR